MAQLEPLVDVESWNWDNMTEKLAPVVPICDELFVRQDSGTQLDAGPARDLHRPHAEAFDDALFRLSYVLLADELVYGQEDKHHVGQGVFEPEIAP